VAVAVSVNMVANDLNVKIVAVEASVNMVVFDQHVESVAVAVSVNMVVNEQNVEIVAGVKSVNTVANDQHAQTVARQNYNLNDFVMFVAKPKFRENTEHQGFVLNAILRSQNALNIK
jgi:hypothetical protein